MDVHAWDSSGKSYVVTQVATLTKQPCSPCILEVAIFFATASVLLWLSSHGYNFNQFDQISYVL